MPTSSTLTIPNTFVARTPAESAEMNANFAAVATLINTTGLGSNNIKDGTVTADLLEAGTIAGSVIPDAGITRGKLAALGQQSASVASFSTTSGSATDVTGLSVSLTTTGRAVFVGLQASSGSSESVITGTANTNILFVRGSTTFANFATPTVSSPGGYATHDAPAAGTYTYKVQVQSDGADTIAFTRVTLIAYEL